MLFLFVHCLDVCMCGVCFLKRRLETFFPSFILHLLSIFIFFNCWYIEALVRCSYLACVVYYYFTRRSDTKLSSRFIETMFFVPSAFFFHLIQTIIKNNPRFFNYENATIRSKSTSFTQTHTHINVCIST